FYESSTFMINDGLSTAILFLHTYALIPLITYLLIRGINEHSERFLIISAFLTILVSSTMPNFKDLAFLGVILTIFLAYRVASHGGLKITIISVSKFVSYSILFNMAWLLPILINI